MIKTHNNNHHSKLFYKIITINIANMSQTHIGQVNLVNAKWDM